MGKLLRMYWQPVAVAADVAPGKTLPVRIMNEDLTVYRGQSGSPYVVGSRCAHRRTVLHIGWVEGECLRCMFHGWKYDGSGQCVEAPAEGPSFPQGVKILSYPAEDYAGLIFAYMGEGVPPDLPRYSELGRADGIQWARGDAGHPWPCNWFQRVETTFDSVHVHFTHEHGAYPPSGVRIEAEETDWGIRADAYRATDFSSSEFIWPNCHHRLRSDSGTDVFTWFVPMDDEQSLAFRANFIPVLGDADRPFEEALESSPQYFPAEHAEQVFARQKVWNQEDEEFVTRVGQGPIADYTQERLGQSDVAIILRRKIFEREMEAIAQGRPTKRWKPRVSS